MNSKVYELPDCLNFQSRSNSSRAHLDAISNNEGIDWSAASSNSDTSLNLSDKGSSRTMSFDSKVVREADHEMGSESFLNDECMISEQEAKGSLSRSNRIHFLLCYSLRKKYAK